MISELVGIKMFDFVPQLLLVSGHEKNHNLYQPSSKYVLAF